MTNQSSITGLQAAVARTRAATSLTLRRREPRAVFIGVTSGYLLVYLWVIGHLAPGLGGYGVTVDDEVHVGFDRPAVDERNSDVVHGRTRCQSRIRSDPNR